MPIENSDNTDNADNAPSRPEPGPDAGVEDIQADIDQTRHELGDTVEALSAKADVSGRAKQKVADTQANVAEKAGHAKDVVVEKAHVAQTVAHDALTNDTGSVKRSVPVAALIAGAAVLAGLVLWRRRHC